MLANNDQFLYIPSDIKTLHIATPTKSVLSKKIFCLAPRILWQPAKSSQTAQIRSVKYFFTATLTPVYHRVFREVLFAANSHFFVIFFKLQ